MSQVSYSETLSSRLTQIRKLDLYDNKVVFAIDSVNYSDMSFPYWNANRIYYRDDVARYNNCAYVALKDAKGQRPDTARTIWTLVFGPHPSLFLRDTARVDDLKRLLLDKHTYVKMYAFAGLSFRKEKDLFSIIVQNLADTTQILAYWGDAGRHACPADLMIEYEAHRLSVSEKKRLRKLIEQKYPHVKWGLEMLSRK